MKLKHKHEHEQELHYKLEQLQHTDTESFSKLRQVKGDKGQALQN